MSDLARRLLSCPRFRYMPGMLDIYGRRIIRVDGDKLTVAWYGNPHHRLAPDITVVSAAAFPLDLADPATVGCLLALVRAALEHNGASILVEVRWSPTAPGWRIVRWDRAGSIAIGLDDHPTEAAALVAAMEAAP